MTSSRKIKVRKRDGSLEAFDPARLGATMVYGLNRTGGPIRLGRDLARAVELYLRRRRRSVVSSTALFEMAVKALRRVCMGEAAEVIELHRTLRAVRRPLLEVRHDGGHLTKWDKSWLAMMGERTWGLSRRTARIFAGEIELQLLPQESRTVDRQAVIDLLNERVARFGLADAVPLRQYAPQD
jgi:hypothetical protein